jgi:hypothetical protein
VLAPSPVTVAFGGSNYYELREDFPEVSFATVETPTGSPATADVNTPESITNRRKRLGFIKDWRGGGTYVTPINTTTTGSPSQADFIPAGYHERQPPTVAFDPNAQVYGSDVLMNNVLSMRVQVIANNNTQFGDLVQPAPATPTWPQVYDTAAAPGSVDAAAVTSAGIQKARIKAIRIVIRAYDVKNQATRQITITRDL